MTTEEQKKAALEWFDAQFQGHFNQLHTGNFKCCEAITAIRAALASEPMGWMDISTAPKEKSILLGYFNDYGNWRTLRGRWFDAGELFDYNEEAWDSPEGWYEESVEKDDWPNVWPTNPTFWQPMPSAPPTGAT